MVEMAREKPTGIPESFMGRDRDRSIRAVRTEHRQRRRGCDGNDGSKEYCTFFRSFCPPESRIRRAFAIPLPTTIDPSVCHNARLVFYHVDRELGCFLFLLLIILISYRSDHRLIPSAAREMRKDVSSEIEKKPHPASPYVMQVGSPSSDLLL